MTRSDLTRLKKHLDTSVREACRRTLVEEGSLEAEEWERLDRLQQLLALRESLSRPGRWSIALTLLVSLVLVSSLLFWRPEWTEIELDLLATEASFELAEEQVVLGPTTLTSLGVGGLRKVRGLELLMSSEAVRFSAPTNTAGSGTIDLVLPRLSPGSQVGLRALSGDSYRLKMEPGTEESHYEIEAVLRGTILIQSVEQAEAVREFKIPRTVGLEIDSRGVDVEFALGRRRSLEPHLAISDLRLSSLDSFQNPEGVIVRRRSTIETGTLYLESLGGRAETLRPGQSLRFESVQGVIRRLELDDRRIRILFNGRVSGMRTGLSTTSRSLMPTSLEWLMAQQPLALLWGASLWAFGVVLAIANWWRSWR